MSSLCSHAPSLPFKEAETRGRGGASGQEGSGSSCLTMQHRTVSQALLDQWSVHRGAGVGDRQTWVSFLVPITLPLRAFLPSKTEAMLWGCGEE